jgi:hypothetical protein
MDRRVVNAGIGPWQRGGLGMAFLGIASLRIPLVGIASLGIASLGIAFAGIGASLPTLASTRGNSQMQIAHNVEVDGTVAVTMHLEPNHAPRAGEPAQIWFALARKGGELIPLDQCQCELQIYAASGPKRGQRLLSPDLRALRVESYRDVPSAQIRFPAPGEYTVQLVGKPKTGKAFGLFRVQYPVAVTPGSAQTLAEPEPTKAAAAKESEPSGQSPQPQRSPEATRPPATKPHSSSDPSAAEAEGSQAQSVSNELAPFLSLRNPQTWVSMVLGIALFIGISYAALRWEQIKRR